MEAYFDEDCVLNIVANNWGESADLLDWLRENVDEEKCLVNPGAMAFNLTFRGKNGDAGNERAKV